MIKQLRIGPTLRYAAWLGMAALLILLCLEGILRIAGYPTGLYNFRPLDQSSLYHPNTTIHQVSGPLPYIIKTNNIGLRGEDVQLEKSAGITRIVALGDSVTEGFYVDNHDTYPAQLQEILKDRGHNVEVINVSQGYSSIDKEKEMLERYALPLKPDLVILTFVSNDIGELRGKSEEDILNGNNFNERPAVQSEWFLFGRTALGEVILDTMMRWQLRNYNRNRDALRTGHRAQVMPGGDKHIRNAEHFLTAHAIVSDGIPAYTTITPKWEPLIALYKRGLRAVKDVCEQANAKLIVSYHPDYSEIYMPDRPAPMHLRLKSMCAELDIPFHDQKPAFRQSREEVLHFAPVDFHPNAYGNRLIATDIANFLTNNDLIEVPGDFRPVSSIQ
jgi:lysophospholipase L1-like esterase